MTISYTLLTTRTKQWVTRNNNMFGKQFLHLGEYLVIKIEKKKLKISVTTILQLLLIMISYSCGHLNLFMHSETSYLYS